MKQTIFILVLCVLSALALTNLASGATQLPRRIPDFTTGELVLFQGVYARVINSYKDNSQTKYRLVFANLAMDTGFTGDMLYKTEGCMEDGGLCVGASVSINGTGTFYKLLGAGNATVIGITVDEYAVKYALRFQNGYVDTGYLREMLSLN